jgi:hypothetical protein
VTLFIRGGPAFFKCILNFVGKLAGFEILRVANQVDISYFAPLHIRVFKITGAYAKKQKSWVWVKVGFLLTEWDYP